MESVLNHVLNALRKGLKIYFMPEAIEFEVVIQSEAEASNSKTVNISESKNLESKVMTNSESKTPKIQILKRPEPKSQVLKNSTSGVLKSKFQTRKTIVSWDSRSNDAKPKVLNEHKPLNFKQDTKED